MHLDKNEKKRAKSTACPIFESHHDSRIVTRHRVDNERFRVVEFTERHVIHARRARERREGTARAWVGAFDL